MGSAGTSSAVKPSARCLPEIVIYGCLDFTGVWRATKFSIDSLSEMLRLLLFFQMERREVVLGTHCAHQQSPCGLATVFQSSLHTLTPVFLIPLTVNWAPRPSYPPVPICPISSHSLKFMFCFPALFWGYLSCFDSFKIKITAIIPCHKSKLSPSQRTKLVSNGLLTKSLE